MSNKPTSVQIVSAKSLSTSSTGLVKARPAAQPPRKKRIIAAWLSVAGLLALAGIGIFFSFHTRSKPQPNATEPIHQNAVTPPLPRRGEIQRVNAVSKRAPSPTEISFKTGPDKETNPKIAALPKQAPEMAPVKTEPAPDEKAPSPPTKAEPKITATPETTEDPPKSAPRPAIDYVAKSQKVPGFPDTHAPARKSNKERFGTMIDFFQDILPAFEESKEDGNKLLMVVYYSGRYQNSVFTSPKVERFRRDCLSDETVGNVVRENFICVCQPINRHHQAANTGDVVTFVCLPNGTVINAIPSSATKKEFLRETDGMLKTLTESDDQTIRLANIREAHSKFFTRPPQNPKALLPQARIHSILGYETQTLPKLDEFAKKVFVEILDEKFDP